MAVMIGQTSAVAGRILLEQLRMKRNLIFWGVFPALMLLLFGMVYAGGRDPAHSFDNTAPGIFIGAALFFSCLGGPAALIAAERERRTLRRLLLSPLKPSAYFLGIFTAFTLVAAAQGVVILAISKTFGGSYHGSPVLGLIIFLLCVLCYAGIGFWFGARMTRRTEEVNGPLAAFGVPLLVLGGTFFPISLLPPYLLKVAYLDPVFHMNQAMKAVWAQGSGVEEVGANLAALALFGAGSLIVGVRAYRQLMETERRG